MTAKPWLLDTCCGAGGATRGYQQAGFRVAGVDIEPQPNYCGEEFIQADALGILADRAYLARFDAIHASPTCQHQANVTNWRGDRSTHPDTLTPTLALLARLSVPWVLENVPEALSTWDYVLCGSQFGLQVKRHRGFRRGNWTAFDLLPPCQHARLLPFMHKGERAYTDAMGCTWMTRDEGRQAIPPAYCEYLGRQLLDALEAAA